MAELSDEERAFLEAGLDEEDDPSKPTDTEQRRALRDAGLDVPYTKGDLLEELYSVLTAENPYERRTGDQAQKFTAFEEQRKQALGLLYGAYQGEDSKTGRVFRPSTIQQPSQKQLLGAAQEATMGPDPQSLFRTVFQEAFPAMGRDKSPFNEFVQRQEKELEGQFMQNVFKEFTTPGKIDELKGDYEKLVRQQESGSFAGAGGSVPAFEDFVKGRFESNYLTFLAEQKPTLQRAFELATPEERGQRDAGQLAPLSRKL